MSHSLIIGHTLKLAFVGLLGICAQLAQAQSYTSRELKPPLGASSSGCIVWGNQVLSDNGDVIGACQFFEGYYLSDLLAGIPLPYSLYQPVAWRNNGTVQRLSKVARSSTGPFSGMGIDAQGRVLADVSVATVPGDVLTPWGRLPTEQELGRTLWTGNTRTKWVPPAGFEGFRMIGWASPAGRTVITQSDGLAPLLAITQGSTAQNVPAPPLARYVTEAVVNDIGQLAVSIVVGESSYNDESNVEQWFWNGAAWSRMDLPAMPTFRSHWRPRRITANGAVLLASSTSFPSATSPARVLWQAGTGATEVPGDLNVQEGYRGDLANNGDLVGEVGVAPASRATLWRNGQAIDLNTMVKPPSGFTFASALSVNKRGQILLRAVPAKPSLNARIMLLTPK